MYKKYANLRPKGFSEPNDPFYVATRTIPLSDQRSEIWYIKQKLGVNKIGKIMAKMVEKMSKNCRIWETPYEHKHKKILCSETSGEKHSTHGHNAGHGP